MTSERGQSAQLVTSFRDSPVFGKPFLHFSGSRHDMSTEAASHPEDVSLCHQIMDEQQATITGLQRRTERLEHYIEQLLRSKYGPRSERVAPNQLPLFDVDGEQSPDASPVGDAERQDAVVVREHRRRGGGRQALPDHLPRETVEHDLSDDEKCCPECGEERQRIGCERSEQLEFVPAVLKVLEHVRWKYACRWALQTADLLEPLYRLMIERVRSSAVIHTDDTPVPVLDPALPKTRTACECFVTVRSTATLRSNHGYRTTILVLFGFRRVIVQPLSSTQLTGLPNTRRLRARLHPAGLRRDFW